MDREPARILHSVIVPAFNEEHGLPIVLEKIFRVVDDTYEVIVVDDGSTDGTGAAAVRFPCRLIRHEKNRGKGEALKTGVQAACGANVIWIDADDTYPTEVIPQIARGLSDSCDLIYTSRRSGRGRIPAFNRVGNTLFSWAVRGLYGFKPYDPCSGLCGAHKEDLLRMRLRARKFSIESEIAMKAGRMRLRMLDIPIEYRPRIGQAKLSGINAGWEITVAIVSHLPWQPDRDGAPP